MQSEMGGREIRFHCPACEKKLRVDSSMADIYMVCPLCGATVRPWGSRLVEIRFQCERCRGKLAVTATAAGREVTCPKCSGRTAVPGPNLVAKRPIPGPASPVLTEEEVSFLRADG